MGVTTRQGSVWPSRDVAVGADEPRSVPSIDVRSLSRRFGSTEALRGVSLEVEAGEIHALLGRNGAGKTTLIRTLAGLVDADDGELRVTGELLSEMPERRARQLIGLVPSGDRTFYLRISGLENLVFFGRLHGLRRADAAARSLEVLRQVGLEDAARRPVSTYSHGMQKRLSVARALLMSPAVLLIDEATHDLDPQAARTVRNLVAERAAAGSAIVWATQRIDEIRGFAGRVTLLDEGVVRFTGTLPEFMSVATARRHLVQLRSVVAGAALASTASAVVGDLGALVPSGDADGEHYVLALQEGTTLGEAVARLVAAGIDVVSCREERSGIEEAFLSMTGGDR
jgi:ABC-2 type transport system ATP-binding protein